MEARFRRDLGDLPSIFSMARAFCAANSLGDEEARVLSVILEELFTNIVKYGGAKGDDIAIVMDIDGGEVTLSITDFDAERFDIRLQPDVDVGHPLGERQPGGLGLHLVRKFADRIDYDYDHRRSTITISRRLP